MIYIIILTPENFFTINPIQDKTYREREYMKCMNCDIEVSDKAKYCSDKCRMQFRRKSNNQPEQSEPEQAYPNNFGGDDCECMMCKTRKLNGSRHVINHGAWKSEDKLGKLEVNRVSLPGDVDY